MNSLPTKNGFDGKITEMIPGGGYCLMLHVPRIQSVWINAEDRTIGKDSEFIWILKKISGFLGISYNTLKVPYYSIQGGEKPGSSIHIHFIGPVQEDCPTLLQVFAFYPKLPEQSQFFTQYLLCMDGVVAWDGSEEWWIQDHMGLKGL